MFNHSQNFVVSGGSWTVVHGNSITYESQHAMAYPTNSPAKIAGLNMLYENIAAGAMHNSEERYDAPNCHPDTRKAVLNDITSWISDHSKKTLILWLSAPAGSGKSAILQQIAESFHNSGGLLASFFFSRTAAKRSSAVYLVATLASQLATSISATRPFIEQAIERDPSIFDRRLSEQMTRLVVHPLIYVSLHPENGSPWPTLLVIDGLDECNGGERQVDILRILRGALLQLRSSLPRLYLVIASRPEPAITATFDYELSEITHRLVLDDTYDPDRDISVFLRSSFADIYRRRNARFPSMASLPRPWPPEHIISFLVRKSSGQFVFAATIIRFIDVDRKIPTAQLQLILDICGSMDSSRFAANPFALLDKLYSHVLNSSEETERVISILGAIFYLSGEQSPTLELLQILLQLKPEDITVIFWDLHSIIHIPASDNDPIIFYHASLRDFLTDRHRSGNLHVDGSKAHSLLLKSCIQTLSDFHGRSIHERTTLALRYSKDYYISHYVLGDTLNPGFLDKVLEEFNPETWLAFDKSADELTFVSWWNNFSLLRDYLHSRCDMERCSALCLGHTSVVDRYLVYRFQKHENPAVVASLMWLTLLGPINCTPMRLGRHTLIIKEAKWLRDIQTYMGDAIKFFHFLTCFLSNHGRSSNVFVGRAISTINFAQVCAQRAWRGILALDRPFGSENWRMLIYLCEILNLFLRGNTSYWGSSGVTEEVVIQSIRMRIADLADLVKFVEATSTEEEEESFENQVSRWRNSKAEGTSSTDLTTALSEEPSLYGEVETARSWGKRGGKSAASSNKGSKRRKLSTNGLTDPGDKTVAERVPPCRESGASVNDGRDMEHAIEVESD